MTTTDQLEVTVRLTVLGSSGSFASAGSACSGYLVRTATTTLLLDAGNGSTTNLHREVSPPQLDGILISHRHADHCVDLIGLHHAVRWVWPSAVGTPLYAPDGVIEMLAELSSREAPYLFEDSFDVQPVAAGDVVTIGDIDVALFDSAHPVPTVSMRLEAEGRVLTYSGDSAGGPQLVEAARDCDLLLCEATWQGDAGDHPDGIHLTAAGAGAVATEARARRLLLTHVAGHLERSVSVQEARTTYDGPLDAAEDRMTTRV